MKVSTVGIENDNNRPEDNVLHTRDQNGKFVEFSVPFITDIREAEDYVSKNHPEYIIVGK